MKTISTFSIVAYDPKTKEFGIGVQSKFLAVGAAVSWAKANVGAIATQAMANLDFGEIGLSLLAKGYNSEQVKDALIQLDPQIEHRQFGVVDKNGHAISYTGKSCFDYAGGLTSKNVAVQGNILVSQATTQALMDTYLKHEDLSIARRIVLALDAAAMAGGDKRGRQSASLLVVKENGSYGGYNDRYIDLRVDDDPEPILKLAHLLDLFEIYFGKTKDQDKLEVDSELALLMQHALHKLGFYNDSFTSRFDIATKTAYENWCGWENYEERILPENLVDKSIIEILLKQAKNKGE